MSRLERPKRGYKTLKHRYVRARMLLLRDLPNRVRHGRHAPRYAERIWVRTSEIRFVGARKLKSLKWKRSTSGLVIDTWPVTPDDYIEPMELDKFASCHQRWVEGMDWRDTREFSHYAETSDPSYDFDRHHEILDRIFMQAQRERRLRPKSELESRGFREDDGIRINVGPNRELVFTDGGTHRLAMALLLGIPCIPAQIGCVARTAIPCLPELRQRPADC